jgi:hypothetical protein
MSNFVNQNNSSFNLKTSASLMFFLIGIAFGNTQNETDQKSQSQLKNYLKT